MLSVWGYKVKKVLSDHDLQLKKTRINKTLGQKRRNNCIFPLMSYNNYYNIIIILTFVMLTEPDKGEGEVEEHRGTV